MQVIYLTDVIDEPVFNSLEKYDGHSLIDVTRESPDLGETEEEKQQVCSCACLSHACFMACAHGSVEPSLLVRAAAIACFCDASPHVSVGECSPPAAALHPAQSSVMVRLTPIPRAPPSDQQHASACRPRQQRRSSSR